MCPTDAIPRPRHPHLAPYRKQRTDIVKACQSATPLAWATRRGHGVIVAPPRQDEGGE